ncbi:hypothetical protein NDU88_009680 [Pleurodeles waltl]|uniref:Uncharacterized protein n=1 Tax=Pleurodeles waltl TaxID=8319 RepID=A0AAV7S0D9_PLEWA|nr:hypothetical protein NDU88_009680 [Pleurodeles waltl]
MQANDNYVEEETISVLPIDSEFCEALDASVNHAVASNIELLERRLLQLAYTCPMPLNITGPQPLDRDPLRWAEQLLQCPPKRRIEARIDFSAFDRIKQALLQRPSPTLLATSGDTLSASGDLSGILPSGEVDEDESQGDSPDEAGPSRIETLFLRLLPQRSSTFHVIRKHLICLIPMS